MNRQLTNLAGVLAVIVLLVAGIVIVALPMYSQSQAIDTQTRTVSQSNALYEQQLLGLSAAEGRIDEIDRDLADLRGEIAATMKLDDIHQLVAAAAQRVDVQVDSVSAADPGPWEPRTSSTSEPTATGAGADGMSDGEGEGEESAEDSAGSPSATAPADPAGAEDPRQQVLVTVAVDVTRPFVVADGGASSSADGAVDAAEMSARAARAAAFVDALGSGERLLAPVDISYVDGKLTVTALTFFRTETP